MDIAFADDNSQSVIYPGRGREALARRTASEIERINHYERLWKIRTNHNKFQLVSISSTKPKDVVVNGNLIPFKKNVKILGLTLTTHGLSHHINQRKARANHQLTKLKRFRNMEPRLKLKLYKSMIRPIMEYPLAPICVASKDNIKKLPRTQNKALRSFWPGNVIEDRITNVQAHKGFGIETLSIRLYKLAATTWTLLEILEEELVHRSDQLNNEITNDHSWWPRLSPYILGREPPPLY